MGTPNLQREGWELMQQLVHLKGTLDECGMHLMGGSDWACEEIYHIGKQFESFADRLMDYAAEKLMEKYPDTLTPEQMCDLTVDG